MPMHADPAGRDLIVLGDVAKGAVEELVVAFPVLGYVESRPVETDRGVDIPVGQSQVGLGVVWSTDPVGGG